MFSISVALYYAGMGVSIMSEISRTWTAATKFSRGGIEERENEKQLIIPWFFRRVFFLKFILIIYIDLINKNSFLFYY